MLGNPDSPKFPSCCSDCSRWSCAFFNSETSFPYYARTTLMHQQFQSLEVTTDLCSGSFYWCLWEIGLQHCPSILVLSIQPFSFTAPVPQAQSQLLRDRLVELETEIEHFKKENAALTKLRQENEKIRENLRSVLCILLFSFLNDDLSLCSVFLSRGTIFQWIFLVM